MDLLHLFHHERESLLAALRRDLNTERSKAVKNPEAVVHGYNARQTLRLLESINPRSAKRSKYESRSDALKAIFHRDQQTSEA